jgi:signal transduction histidine kinase
VKLFRKRHLGQPTGGWLIFLLLLAATAPSVCVIWFMNQAVHNERLAVRQEWLDAYRERLVLAQTRLDGDWSQLAAMRPITNAAEAGRAFARAVRGGRADGLVLLDTNGAVFYPFPTPLPQWRAAPASWALAERAAASNALKGAEQFHRLAEGTLDANLAAGALLNEVRCLLQGGEMDQAIAVTETLRSRFAEATDSQGRLIAPNAELMVLEARHGSPDLFHFREQLESYDPMPSAQRRFLMQRWQALFPKERPFATLPAEELAARYVENGGELRPEAGLRLSKAAGIWRLPTADGRALFLFDTNKVTARLQQQLRAGPGPVGARLIGLPPGQSAENVVASLDAGATLPGWRVAVTLQDKGLFETAAQAQIASYLWAGVASVGAVAVLAFLAVGLIRRQTALAQLRSDLVANVTHELKTPLSSMRLLVDTLLQTEPLHEPTAREYLRLIARENLRLSRLIDNFLTFSRIERNKYAFDFAEASPARIAETAAATVRERFTTPECRFEVTIPRHLPPVRADADAIVTALLNLLENAYKYSGDDKHITLVAGAENGSVFFTVTDNGIGLSPRETKRIFRRFYRVDQPQARSAGGCGLGLSIVQFIVKAHRGAVRVESQPGRGSSFVISIPRAPMGEQIT